MKPKRLTRNFFARDTLLVAKEMLGKYLTRQIGVKKLKGKIVEVEVYIGPKDKASHAYAGKITARNRAEYLIGGYVYIYLVYGMYWQLNITTGLAGKPECVLIRALEPALPLKLKIKNSTLRLRLPKFYPLSLSKGKILAGFAQGINSKLFKNLSNGPGKLCRWLKLDKSFYGEDLTKSKRIWLEDKGTKVKPAEIAAAPRIGIDYAGPYWSKRKWRFFVKNNPYVSKS